MNSVDRILLADDEEPFLRSASLALRLSGESRVDTCAHGKEALEILRRGEHAVAFLDLDMPGATGMEILRAVSEEVPSLSVCLLTAHNDVPTAVEAMRLGAYDYLVKPIHDRDLTDCLRRVREHRALHLEASSLKRSLLDEDLRDPAPFEGIVTRHPSMMRVFRYVEAIARSPLPVLISGETGTGKEALARSVHESSRRTGPFVVVNAAGIDDVAFSDTLFGHLRGAFTGADRDRKGLVEEAAQGTLFLDEIGDLKPESQVKLLRLLQEGTYYPLGSDKPRTAQTRIVAATHRDLAAAREAGTFRADLFYRLHPHEIRLPPLRERLDDILPLAQAFVAEAAEQFSRKPPVLPAELWPLLRNHAWPGNIRELKGLLQDAVGRSTGTALSLQPLRERLGDARREPAGQIPSEPSEHGFAPDARLPTLQEMEDILVREALRRTGGNRTQAADLLGMSRQTMVRKARGL